MRYYVHETVVYKAILEKKMNLGEKKINIYLIECATFFKKTETFEIEAVNKSQALARAKLLRGTGKIKIDYGGNLDPNSFRVLKKIQK